MPLLPEGAEAWSHRPGPLDPLRGRTCSSSWEGDSSGFPPLQGVPPTVESSLAQGHALPQAACIP